MDTHAPGSVLSLAPILPPALRPWSTPLEPALRKLLIPAKVRLSYEQARRSGTGSTFAKCLLDLLDIHLAIDERDLRRVPAAGPAMIAANHPYGIVEGLILAAILDRIRPDWYILANSVLSAICELREHLILVNPFETREAVSENVSPLRRAMKGLARGHLISMFPAGEVAHPSWRDLAVTDPAWKETCARLALKARCCVVPLFFEGCNSASFHLAGVLHPGLRTVGLAHEFSKLAGKTVQLRVGNAIAPSVLAGYPNARQATEYIRARTYFLGHRCEAQRAAPSMLPVSRYVPARGDVLARRIASLPATCEVAANRDFAVYASQADGIPEILDEIGRCREVAFRQAGEGTGADRDLDRFDRYYLHLFLWSKADSCIAGAYRLAVTTDVLREHGLSGLYTNTLFRFDRRFFERLGPAVELGRSFVMPRYQKNYSSLLLLWRGILQLVRRRPEAPRLFGAVSISREYRAASRSLIASYLSECASHDLAFLVHPRRRFHHPAAGGPTVRRFASIASSIEDISLSVEDIEPDGKGIPVLLRQYLKTGGRLLGLNLDPHFSDVLDALLLADLREAPLGLLERCMGKAEARQFLEIAAGEGIAARL